MSRFRKRHVQEPAPGTRTSPQTGQLITSSGNPSLDVILGGGLPIGSICLIEEDKYVTYSKVLAKYFLAEGVISSHAIFFGSLDDNPSELLHKLPRPLDEAEVAAEAAIEKENGDAPKNGLRIAWRYNDLPPVNSEQTPSKIGHHFNLLEQMDHVFLKHLDSVLWNGKRSSTIKTTVVDNAFEVDDDDDDEKQEYYGASLAAHSRDDAIDQQHVTSSSGGPSNTSAKDVEMETTATAAAATTCATPMEVTSSISGANSTTTATDDTVSAMDVTNDNEAHSAVNTTPEAQKLNFSSGSSSDELKGILPPNMPPPPPPPPPMLPAKASIFENDKYLSLLDELQPLACEEQFTTSALVQRSLCRICITSLGSPLWYDEQFPKDILKFLTVLRATVRNSVSVCFITMPMHLVAKCDATLVSKIRNLVDYAIELESFAGSERETNPIFKEYNGLLHLRKITAVNTLSAYMPETSDLAFKLRRKKFVIEKLHLPPELQEAADANADDKPTISCQFGGAAAGKAALDF